MYTVVLLLKQLELLYLTNCRKVSGGKQLEGAFSFSPTPDFEIVVKKNDSYKDKIVSSVCLLSVV